MLAPGTAAATFCGDLPPMDQAVARTDLVFVGVVEGVTNMDRWATVRVEDVWRGAVDVPRTEVRGGNPPGVWSDLDRTYQTGQRYLFFVSTAEDELADHACSPTSPWRPELVRFRPADARLVSGPPTADAPGFDPGLLVVPVLAIGCMAVAIGGLLVALRTR